ncbi:MAG: hypothetical protein ACK4OE_13465, partial [Acidovorax sp.]|uniref:hypothetical protein n=1 Tax=Acidovorax sp. TaxID=1872122 RepID=UPI00391D9FD9
FFFTTNNPDQYLNHQQNYQLRPTSLQHRVSSEALDYSTVFGCSAEDSKEISPSLSCSFRGQADSIAAPMWHH